MELRSKVASEAGRWPQAKLISEIYDLLLAAGVAALAVAATVLVGRRLTGAFARPVPGAALVALAVIATSIAAAAAVRSRWLVDPSRGVLRWMGRKPIFAPLEWLAAAALVATAAAVTLPGTPAASLFVLWGPPAALLAWSGWKIQRTRRGGRLARASKRASLGGGTLEHEPRAVTRATEVAPGEHLALELARVRTADGGDTIRGFVGLRFEPGQRSASAHLAFCPPFSRMPELRASVRRGSEPSARIKVAQLHPYGARLDLRLSASSFEAREVLVDFTATSKPAEETVQDRARRTIDGTQS